MLRSIDYSGLIYPVDAHDVTEFRTNRRDWFGYSQFSTAVKVVFVSAIAVLFVIVIGTQVAGSLASVVRTAQAEGSLLPAIPAALFFVITLAVTGFSLVVGIRVWRRRGSSWQRYYRMNKFAEDNALTFAPRDTAISYPGLIFGHGSSKSVRNRFRSSEGRALDYGNFSYVTGSGKNRRTHNWGYLALELDRALPHMVLDAVSNNQLFGVTNLPQSFAKNQVLKLEGDFNSHFTLYCPREYERDALYVFTPDLMALLIDHAAPYDVEVIDNWLLVYSIKEFDLVDPAQHRRLLGIADTVGTKALRQSRNYADERIGDYSVNLVAPQGQRLKNGASITTAVMVSLVAAFWIAQFAFRTFA
ncbi:hypothetical protein [Salinibacterium sp. PAMC 21357]|uniref:hypothetical protein n=1 Tax=Salinibacterium sp. PAMC 21357 TaxID=1112215 RepID=UPI000288F8ED|nr:hypothetical protein [Salinibacterium sp. PAMC 21357]